MATRIRLDLAYDGRPFAGWQSQASGNTIQDRIQFALARICDQPVAIFGAGRTDAGVHALGQVAHFDSPSSVSHLDPIAWRRALNANLPPEIRVVRVRKTPDSFHARFSVKEKIYRYDLVSGDVLPPHAVGRAWHVPLLEASAGEIQAILDYFVGTHDFANFAANRGKPPTHTIRTIQSIRVTASGSRLSITFRGKGFLYKMVRMLTGAAVRVAIGKLPPTWIPHLLANPGIEKCHHVAPADGLYLVRILYKN